MKKRIVFLLFAIFVLCLSSCSGHVDLPDNVTVEGKEYKKAFVGELYPLDEVDLNQGITVSGKLYNKHSKTKFDCYVSYDRNAEPNVYFAEDTFDEAMLYYSDSKNFDYFCLFGNIHDTAEQQLIDLGNINDATFDSLIEFSKDNDYNPLDFSNGENGLIKIPIADPDHWIANEIHFYKESKDGAFTTSKGYTFIVHENKLYFLYQYDFSDDNAPIMLVRQVPSEIGDYFCDLLKELSNE